MLTKTIKKVVDNILVDELLLLFPTIDDINYTHKILCFAERFSNEELDAIYDLLVNKWDVNKRRQLNKNTSYNNTYDNNHRLIERQLIMVENCDLYVMDGAYDFYEYLEDDYELYIVHPKLRY